MKLYYTTEEQFQEFIQGLSLATSDLDMSKYFNQKPLAFVQDGIGHVFVFGMLLANATPIEKEMGATDYRDIMAELEMVVSQGAKGVILHVNSGGGQVLGCIEAAESIQNLPVPVVGLVQGIACSAAYKLICGATYIIAGKSSMSGNIGSITALTDTSKAYANMGIIQHVFTNEGATLKGIGKQALTEEQKAFLQESINEAGTSFQDHVTNNRPNLDQSVFDARWVSGVKAVELGLVDEVGNLATAEERLKQIIEAVNPTPFDTATDSV